MGWVTHRITGAGDSCHIAKEKAANGKNRGRGLEMLLSCQARSQGKSFPEERRLDFARWQAAL